MRLMCVLAHPDDEALGAGSTLARYAAEGVETYLVCATRGERGWAGPEEEDPGLEALGRLRESELRCSAGVLGLREVCFLDYIDGDLDQADPREAIGKIAAHIRRIQPQVVLTFGPDGDYGHPDHIAISQFTTGATLLAASSAFEDPGKNPPHPVAKLYYMVMSPRLRKQYIDLYGEDALVMPVDGVDRRMVAYPEWVYATILDNRCCRDTTLRAILCHESQIAELGDLMALSIEQQDNLFGFASFLRAFSLVNGGRKVEDDLFTGLR